MPDSIVGHYGVSASEVLALVPYVRVTAEPAAPSGTHPYGGGAVTERAITMAEVNSFIGSVTSRVRGHAAAGDRFAPDHWITAYLAEAGADAVKNGAAAYVMGAVSPEGGAGGTGMSYESVLWQRFLEALKEIDEAIGRADKEPGPVVPGAAGPVGVSTRPARFPDGLRL